MNVTVLGLTLEPIAGRIAEMVIAALWQGLLVAGVLAFCLRFLPRVSAAYRFMAWASAFVVLISLSLFPILTEFFAGAVNGVSSNLTVGGTRQWFTGPFNVDARWGVAIAALWLAVALYRMADLAIHSLRLRHWWKDAKPVELDARVEVVLNAVAADIGRNPVELCTSAALDRPSVIGFFKPRILIPTWLYGRLTQSELEQIVLHEAEHLRRRDDWTNLVQKLCLVAFPLNPALAWIERRLCREREMACDEGVVRVTRAPRAYAACLASLAERGLERRVEALSLGAWQRRPELVHRVHSILRGKGGLSPLSARVLLGMLGCGMLAGSVELAQSPQLVAFVPMRAADLANVQGLQSGANAESAQAARLERAMTGARSVRTMSKDGGQFVAMNTTLREPSTAGVIHSGSIHLKAVHEKRPANATHDATQETRALPVVASAKKQPEASVAQEQRWIVLTTWEQVDAPSVNEGPRSNNGGLRSDYDAEAAAASSEGTVPAQPEQLPANRITVTQLIFRIMPANADTHSATKPATSPSANQLGIAAIRDGWLVLQL